MLVKISFRDIDVDSVAHSIYYSSSLIRAIDQAAKNYPNHNTNPTEHEKAVNFVMNQAHTFITSSIHAHDIDPNKTFNLIRELVSEGLNIKERRQTKANISFREAQVNNLTPWNSSDQSAQKDSGNASQTKVPKHVVKLVLDPKRTEPSLNRFIPMGVQNLMQGEVSLNLVSENAPSKKD